MFSVHIEDPAIMGYHSRIYVTPPGKSSCDDPQPAAENALRFWLVA